MNREEAKDELLKLYHSQIVDLTMMSKIELGDDVIEEIVRLKKIIYDDPFIGKTMTLDLGSTPVSVTIKEILNGHVVVYYNNSTPDRIESFSIDEFEHLSGLKIRENKN